MMGVLTKRGNRDTRQGNSPCEDGGREGRDVSTSQGRPEPQELGDRDGTALPQRPGRNQSCLDCRLLQKQEIITATGLTGPQTSPEAGNHNSYWFKPPGDGAVTTAKGTPPPVIHYSCGAQLCHCPPCSQAWPGQGRQPASRAEPVPGVGRKERRVNTCGHSAGLTFLPLAPIPQPCLH